MVIQNSTKPELKKYPRTPHLEGSGIQKGDENIDAIPFSKLRGQVLVCEEKVDGSSAGVSFEDNGTPLLQSRGHYLTGGPREKQFELLKSWIQVIREPLFERLSTRFIMYGEWLYAKHTIFYDRLPHFFMEFDILDTEEGTYTDCYGKEHQGSWLSTPRRRELLEGLPIVSVRVLHEGKVDNEQDLIDMLSQPSAFKTSEWSQKLASHSPRYDKNSARLSSETDPTNLMEGLYVKVEEYGVVKERYKWIRNGFLQSVIDSDSHWMDRPIVPNIMDDGCEVYKLNP